MYTSKEIAQWFLGKESMTQKKIQKLVYYAYSWYLAFNNEPDEEINKILFNDEIEAWVHGPVIPSIYLEYKSNSYHDIDKINPDKVPTFDDDTENLLEQVWDVYGEFNGNELESITHQEKPWLEAREGYGPLDRCNVTLNNDTIKNYYLERVANG